MSGRAERLTSPSVFLGVRDLHSNGWALSTGEPDEEQSRVVVLLPHAAPAFCYSPPPAPVSLHFVSVAAGWRQMIVVWGRPSCCLHVCAYVCPSARLCYGWKQYVCVCVCVRVCVCLCVSVCVMGTGGRSLEKDVVSAGSFTGELQLQMDYVSIRCTNHWHTYTFDSSRNTKGFPQTTSIKPPPGNPPPPPSTKSLPD